MILLFAVFAGALAGLARSLMSGRQFTLPSLRHTWIIFAAILLQALIISVPQTRSWIPGEYVPIFLGLSQLCLLVFVWLNRTQPGFLILGAGLLLNFIVITANGGMMPISPQIASALVPGTPESAWENGARFGWSKDIVLDRDGTNLWQLSDWLLLPKIFSYQYALSPGDLLIAIGAFWFFWANDGTPQSATENRQPATQ
ncbi:DUF5317 domain-containing protein [Chloroflexota bacterium]